MAVNPINELPEPDHRHHLVPLREETRIDRTLHIWARCVCGLEERRSFQLDHDGAPLFPSRVQYRLGGTWMTALDLIRRAAHLPVEECPACSGAGCEACVGLGVRDALGGPVTPRRTAPPSEPAEPGWYDAEAGRIVPIAEGAP